jgi:hypothetical protein
MKKTWVVAAIMFVGFGVAMAASMQVPFFLDDASAGYPPTDGTASFIGLKNTTMSDIVCTVTYTDASGNSATPAANTFVLPANSSLSWRPTINDSTSEGEAGAAVPDAVDLPNDTGSATISWTGTVNDVVGRVVQMRASSSTDSQAYTLPPAIP